MIEILITESLTKPLQCEELMSLALALFKERVGISAETLRLDNLVRHWGSLLLTHTVIEVRSITMCIGPNNQKTVCRGFGICRYDRPWLDAAYVLCGIPDESLSADSQLQVS